MARTTDDELRALTDAEIRDAESYCGGNGRIAAARHRNEYYFLGLPKGELAPPEIAGRSSVVDTTVRDTVLGMEAPLIKTFCGTDYVVEFAATNPDDEQKAKQATDYLNYILRKRNPGYQIISTWIRDALLAKKGFIKVWWDASPIESTEEYKGQTDVQLALLLEDEEVTPTEQRAYPDPDAEKQQQSAIQQMQQQLEQMAAQIEVNPDPAAIQQYQGALAQFEQFQAQPVPMLYDITVKRTKKGGRLRIENVPPEEFMISRRAKSLEDATFIGHRLRRTIGQLKAAGYRNVEDIGSDDPTDGSPEALERDDYNGLARDYGIEADPDAREVWITECYLFADLNGNNAPEWHKVVRAGKAILEREEVDDHPFVDLPSIPLPHRYFGLCPADLAVEHQRIKTSLKRAVLDNIYLQTNGRYFAVADQVNLDDLLNNRPGGVVRIKQVGAVGRLDQGMGDIAGAMSLMESAKLDAEEATGWSRQSQGGNGLQLSQTATQANIVTNRADSRVEIISRTMAETGFVMLFRKMLRLVTQHQDKSERIKLGGEWADIDPREWTNQFDMSINVGLGTGNKDQQVQHLMALGQQQMAGLQIGTVTPENVYNAQVKLAEALGFKNGELFFTDPKNQPPKETPPDPAVVKAQMDAQAKQAQLEFERERAQIQMQADLEKARILAEAQMQVDQNRQQLEAEQQTLRLQLEAEQAERDAQRRHAEQMEKMALERYKIEMTNDAKIVAAQIAAQQKNDASLAAAEDQANKDVANDGNA